MHQGSHNCSHNCSLQAKGGSNQGKYHAGVEKADTPSYDTSGPWGALHSVAPPLGRSVGHVLKLLREQTLNILIPGGKLSLHGDGCQLDLG